MREVYRHYLEFRDHVSRTGNHVIEHGYFIYEEDGETIRGKVNVAISFWDLHDGYKGMKAIKGLSERKREAFFYNVILDKKQKDVAEIMGITTVSVGQYVEQAVMQLSERYFADQQSEVTYYVQPEALECADLRVTPDTKRIPRDPAQRDGTQEEIRK